MDQVVFRLSATSTSSDWNTIILISGQVYESSTWAQWDLVSTLPKYPLIRFNAQTSQEGAIYVHELQFLVCNRPVPTSVSYPQSQYSFYKNYDVINIVPTMFGYTDCSISPPLPDGVTLDPDTCIISGTATVASPSTSYQITSTIGTSQLQTTISITFNECVGTFYKIVGTPTERVCSQCVTMNGQSDGASQKVVLTFTVLLPLSAFSYPQSTYILPRSQSFSDTPLITGDVPVYSIESGELPPGLTLDSMNGMIYGSPSQSITDQNVVIKAENAVSNQTFPLSFTTRILPTVLHYSQDVYYTPINSLFSISPECDGDYIQYSLIDGTLPSGLSFSTSSGVIEGSPVNSTQIMVLTVNATNEVGSVQVVISICVRIPLSLFQYPKSSYRLVRGKSFTVIPSVQGDAPRFRMTSSVLPDGIQLNEMTGEISGIPSTLGDPIDVTIQVWNEVGSEETTLTLVVKRFTILAIVLMIIGGVILFCFVVLVIARMVSINNIRKGSLKTLKNKQYHKI